MSELLESIALLTVLIKLVYASLYAFAFAIKSRDKFSLSCKIEFGELSEVPSSLNKSFALLSKKERV